MMKLRPLLKRLPAVPVPISLLVVLILAFGLMIPWLGFYWDDWPVILTGRLLGVEGYRAFYQYDRPISAWTYMLTYPLLGSSPAGWHVFTLLLRWLTSVAMWWTMVRVWPARRVELTWAAFLFALYPVFTQQSISVAYSQHWICYLLFFLSLAGMVQAQRVKSRVQYWLLTAASVACSLLQLLTMEYFAGLELVRPLLLWLLLEGQGLQIRKRLLAVLRGWLPYLLALMGFVIWRLFFLQFPGESANPPLLLQRMLTDPLGGSLRLAHIALQDLLFILVNAWVNNLSSISLLMEDRFVLLSWGVGILAALVLFFFAWSGRDAVAEGKERWQRQTFLLGAAALIFGMLPVWATDRQIIVGMYSNRFGLAAMFGASLLIVGLVEGWISRPTQRTIVYCTLIAFAIGMHLRVANDYRWAWVSQKRFAWQLSWRAPSIEPGTALFSDGEIFPYVGLYSTSAIVNLTYPPTGQGELLPYWFYSLGREFANLMPEMQAGMPLGTDFRNYRFEGSTEDGIIIHYEPEWAVCLQVLPPEEASNPSMPEITKDALKVTNLGRITPMDASPDYPPVEIFGPEPEPDWCYYYQKMSLAEQQGDWTSLLDLAEQARALNMTPGLSGADVPGEWIPLVRAYAYTGRWDEAKQLTLEILNRDVKLKDHMCRVWSALAADLPPSDASEAAVREVHSAAECPTP